MVNGKTWLFESKSETGGYSTSVLSGKVVALCVRASTDTAGKTLYCVSPVYMSDIMYDII